MRAGILPGWDLTPSFHTSVSKLRLREVKGLARGHTACKWQEAEGLGSRDALCSEIWLWPRGPLGDVLNTSRSKSCLPSCQQRKDRRDALGCPRCECLPRGIRDCRGLPALAGEAWNGAVTSQAWPWWAVFSGHLLPAHPFHTRTHTHSSPPERVSVVSCTELCHIWEAHS